jgi:hypothetical protein
MEPHAAAAQTPSVTGTVHRLFRSTNGRTWRTRFSPNDWVRYTCQGVVDGVDHVGSTDDHWLYHFSQKWPLSGDHLSHRIMA